MPRDGGVFCCSAVRIQATWYISLFRLFALSFFFAPSLLSNSTHSAAAEERDPSLVDFDKISNGAIGEYFRLSAKLGVPLSHQAELVRASFVAQRRLMKIVPQTREPGACVRLSGVVSCAIKCAVCMPVRVSLIRLACYPPHIFIYIYNCI